MKNLLCYKYARRIAKRDEALRGLLVYNSIYYINSYIWARMMYDENIRVGAGDIELEVRGKAVTARAVYSEGNCWIIPVRFIKKALIKEANKRRRQCNGKTKKCADNAQFDRRRTRVFVGKIP